MVSVYKFGQMELSTKVIGIMAKQQEKASLSTLMEIFMKDSGKMIRLVVMEYTNITMVHAIKDIGLMTINMEKELKHGQMVAHILEITNKAKNMGKESIRGKMVAFMMVVGLKIK
jgi:hypothetical protein